MKEEILEQDIASFPSVEDAVDYYFEYYRRHGYPNYELSKYDPRKELGRVQNATGIIEGGIAKQTMQGCGFLWCFFPHWVDVETISGTSISENWKDDAKLRLMIEKTVNWCIKHENSRMSVNRIRQLAKVYLCKQSPSNFRPTVAKAIYDRYGNGGSVYDPCAGWGGRMLGFLASDCKEYVCCDPSTKTYEGLVQLAETFSWREKVIQIYPVCQEDFIPQKEHFNLVFTSPPYFDCEKYCNEPTQSYIKYPTQSKWATGFLEPLISNAYLALKKNGTFVLNIANTKNAKDLEKLSLILAEMAGFKLTETLGLALSSIAGKGVKYEPMFVFKKA